jgi:hypothetical protein
MDRDARPTNTSRRDSYWSGPSPTMESMPRFAQAPDERAREMREPPKELPRRKCGRATIKAVRFDVPPKPVPVEQNSESDDDDDMADYFDMEIGKTEAELSKLETPKIPTQVMARFAALSHGSMVKIVGESEGLLKMVEELPGAENKVNVEKAAEPVAIEEETKQDVEMTDATDNEIQVESEPAKPVLQEAQTEPKPELEPELSINVGKSEEPVLEHIPKPSPEATRDIAEQPTEPPVEKSAEHSETPDEKIVENPEKKPDEDRAENVSEKPIESAVEKSTENIVEKDIKDPVQQTEETHELAADTPATTVVTTVATAAPIAEPIVEPNAEKMDIDIPPVQTVSAIPEAPMLLTDNTAQDTVPMAIEIVPEEPVIESAKTDEKPIETINEAPAGKPSEDKPSETPVEASAEESAQPQTEKATEAVPEVIPPKADEATAEKPAETDANLHIETLADRPEPPTHDHAAAQETPVTVIAPHVVLQTTETASKPPSTPSQVDDDETESEDDSFMNLDTVRQYMTTPPIDSLPDYSCQPWDKDSDFMRTLDSDSVMEDFVIEHLDKMHIEKSTEQDHDKKIYAKNYLRYLEFTMSNDPAAVKSRGRFSVSTGIEFTGTVTPEPKHEGSGRGRRFATERDLERVLQASMREDEERRERELRMQQEKYRTDKEAVIPDMIWTQEDRDNAKYVDKSGYIPVDRLVSTWRVLPPVNNFNEEEASLFEKRYLEAPKQWGRVAEAIPHRDFGACIQYYYMNKKDLNLKEKLKKQPKRRRKGKAKQRSSALVSELGNGDGETEDNHETGENGERRRPRRAAAPTWGFEQPPIDTENSTPNATPGRRGGSAKVDHPEKIDGRKRRRGPKEKEPKIPKPNQTLAAAPVPGKGRSRSNSRALNTDGSSTPLPTSEGLRIQPQFEQHPAGMQLPFSVQQQPIPSMERPQSVAPSSISEVMAAPSLRPDPPPQPAMATFNLAHQASERKAPTQASSYWSVSESNDFPHLLRSFGSDWTGIAAHMGSKTAVMVSRYYIY